AERPPRSNLWPGAGSPSPASVPFRPRHQQDDDSGKEARGASRSRTPAGRAIDTVFPIGSGRAISARHSSRTVRSVADHRGVVDLGIIQHAVTGGANAIIYPHLDADAFMGAGGVTGWNGGGPDQRTEPVTAMADG